MEDELVRIGVEIVGKSWSVIQESIGKYLKQEHNNQVKIKDKWRNLQTKINKANLAKEEKEIVEEIKVGSWKLEVGRKKEKYRVRNIQNV